MIFLVQRAVYIHAKMHCLYMGDLIDLLHIMKVVVLNGGSELTKPDLGPATQSPGHTESAWGGVMGRSWYPLVNFLSCKSGYLGVEQFWTSALKWRMVL